MPNNKIGCRVIYPGKKRNVVIVRNNDSFADSGKRHGRPKKEPKRFLVRIEDSSSTYYRSFLQGVEFPKGKVYVAYDAWRMLSKFDSSSDDYTNAWYPDKEAMLSTGRYSLVPEAV